MPQRNPLALELPPWGVRAAESVHCEDFRMREERHAFHEIYYLFAGSIRYFEAGSGEAVDLGPGQVQPIPRGRAHRIEDRASSTLLLLALEREFVEALEDRRRLWEELAAGRRPIRPAPQQGAVLEGILRRILAEQAAGRLGAATSIQSLAGRFLVELHRLPRYEGQPDAGERLEGLIAELRERCYEPWKVDDAARRVHLSRRRFTQLFREKTGESFIAFRNRLRLENAADQLLRERRSIAVAAFSSGFDDLAHFYRLFKREFGMAPGRWLAERR